MDYLQRKVRILTRLADISVELNSTFELRALLDNLMDAAAEITESEAASVLLWDENTHELRFASTTTHQTDIDLIGSTVPLEGSLAGSCFTQGQIIEVSDTLSDPRHYGKVDQATQFETRSLLAVPMRLKERGIGVLEVVNKRALPWTNDDRETMSVLAAQAAVAIGTVQLVSALQKANQELSELDKLKNDFIAIASHELRTPLSVILGYATFLKEESQGRISQHAEKVLESGLQLRRIIEDLMNLRYLQQSPAEVHRETVPLETIVKEAVQDVQSLIEANEHHLELDLPSGVLLDVDRIRAGMALTNVLNNAARFTPARGHIQVRAEVRNPQEVWLSVADNGIGLAEDQIERIFEKFYQVEDHMTRQHGGLGIGLSIARALVEAQGGRLWASSPGLNQGAVFTFAFPIAKNA